MPVPIIRATKYHGRAEVRASRYFALYLAQAFWIALGIFLLHSAYWPSTCEPKGVIEVFTCSLRLPESRGWVESALFTWLWSTPILVLLDLSRRYRSWLAARAR